MYNVSVVSEMPKYIPVFNPVEVNRTESITRLSEPILNSSRSSESVIPVSTANAKTRLSYGVSDNIGNGITPTACTNTVSAVPGIPSEFE